MKYHFKNAKILSNFEIIDGDVLVDGNKIIYVGAKPPKIQADRVIDVKGNVLMSGFVNAHAHTAMTLLRGISDDTSLEEWLEDNIFPAEAKLAPQDVYWGQMLGIAEGLKAGITTIDEGYFHYDELIKACEKSGIRARIGMPCSFKEKGEEGLYKDIDRLISKLDNQRLKPLIYPHSIYTLTDDELVSCVNYSAKHNLPISIHLSETLKEVGDCTVQTGYTPPEYLESIGFLDRKATLYHCVHVDKDDIQILSNYDANVVTCPSSNLKLGSGICPVYTLINNGVNVAIGTDGAASNNSLDMFKEMFLVSTLNKGTLYDASILPAKEVLKMATLNGAKALGFDSGDIKEGMLADLILVDISGLHHQPVNNVISNLVYSGKSSDVYLTMVDGKILYENGSFNIGEDIDKIIENCKNIATRISGKK